MWLVGRVVFPDFFHPNIASYWDEMVALGHEVVPFDGLWLVRCACVYDVKLSTADVRTMYVSSFALGGVTINGKWIYTYVAKICAVLGHERTGEFRHKRR